MRIIDLSMSIYTGMDIYPDDPEVSVEIFHDYKNKPWLLRRLVLGSHTGTHVDACSHMDQYGQTLDGLPLNKFCGEACLIKETKDANKTLPKRKGLIFNGEIDIAWLAQILSAEPPFVGGNMAPDLQRALLGAGIVTYTNLVNLEQLPEDKSFMFYGLPLKIREGDGSPVRAMALVE